MIDDGLVRAGRNVQHGRPTNIEVGDLAVIDSNTRRAGSSYQRLRSKNLEHGPAPSVAVFRAPVEPKAPRIIKEARAPPPREVKLGCQAILSAALRVEQDFNPR
jgi:hypothetical protein